MTTLVAPRTVDVHQLPEHTRCAAIFDAFDALAPGESVVIVGDAEPREALRRLQADRKGIFEWSPLETGPACFRTALTRRVAQRGARREINEALAWDHDRLDALEQRAFELFAGGDVRAAAANWADFSVGLMRHIRFEEEILFPTFEQKSGFPASHGPTAVMRDEHRLIERLIEAIFRAFAGDGAAQPLRSELHDVLGQHNMKEEHVVYPGTDQQLDPDERDALFARIQSS